MVRKLRGAIYITLGIFDRALNRKNSFVILCYHSIDDDGWCFSTGFKEFKKQMRYMLKNYSPVGLRDVVNYLKKGKSKEKPCFLLTFDDGYKNLLEVALYLTKLGIKPTLFVISDRKNLVRKSIATKRTMLSNDDLKKLSDLGWDIESHGKTHQTLTGISKNELLNEILDSKKDLEKILDKKVTAFSYPHGKYPEDVIDCLKTSGYGVAFSTKDIRFSREVNRFEIPRIGVDGTHSFAEFKYIASPSVLAFRRLVKSTFLGRYL